MHNTANLQQIHWRAPATIVFAFIAGLSFAIGHHVFYRQLDNKPVDSDDRLFDQQVNGAIGTAFAFLFRASLVIAISGVYWQVFWATVLRKRRALALGHLDSLTGLLGSVFNFFDLRVFCGNSKLAAIALLTWLVPLSALLPPATLSVVAVNQPDHRQLNVPVINFTSDALYDPWLNPLDDDDDYRDAYYVGAKSQLRRLATVTAVRRAIPDFASVAVNASYNITFDAPDLECQRIGNTDLQSFQHSMDKTVDPLPTDCYYYNATTWNDMRLSYLSWTHNGTLVEPALKLSDNCQPEIETAVSTTAAVEIYKNKAFTIAWRTYTPKARYFKYGEWNMLNCSLYHGSYTLEVVPTVSSGSSTVKAWSVERREAMATGSHSLTLLSGQTLSEDPLGIDFGYVAVMDCLAQLLKGSIVDWAANSTVVDFNSDVSQTALAFTPELLQVTRTRGLLDLNVDRIELAGTNRSSGTPWPEEVFEATVSNHSLAYAVEQLFQNLTLSLLSKSAFLADTSPRTDVLLDRWLIVYTYNAKNLWISYGVALALTLLACTLGCTTIYRNGASYSNLFSTILRTTRQLQDLDSLLTGRDESGADPLSRCLSTAKIQLGVGRLAGDDNLYTSQIELSQRPLKVASEQNEASEGPSGDTDRFDHDGGSSYTMLPESDASQNAETASERSGMVDWPTGEGWGQIVDEIVPSSHAVDSSESHGSHT